MAPPRRKVLATAEETMTPPDELAEGQLITRVIKATGNNIYLVETPFKESALVELPSRFRSTIWIKRGSYVVIDTNALEGRDNKLKGEIVNIVRDEKAWRKASFWPKEFTKQVIAASDDEESEGESNVGKLPPSDDESDA
ncbi:putative eukaryotic translation initiation factor eIF1a-like protein [Aspergillus saccharolyticus JOP 1030-1]|uniref:Nucleic acid-binding protein n=1 Tax=Aspergillus saccharolyticus JOP 1030-1 TaxID=1450539 RepID=A0A318ZL88_9EURO|nr:nucleic acid-binding protein [Aspergillus saccharolyticus JOP 1030-1]PYH44560.1 nucleic acid-binding protein [Aspergillus saccharolyticus JOP 1030-1]